MLFISLYGHSALKHGYGHSTIHSSCQAKDRQKFLVGQNATLGKHTHVGHSKVELGNIGYKSYSTGKQH